MPETSTNPSDPTNEYSCWMPRQRKSATIARHDLRRFLAGLPGGERFTEVGELLLTELVTNAVHHARVPRDRLIKLRFLLADDRLRIEVHDASAIRPVLREPSSADECGRGLWLVDQLAAEWGADPRPDAIGKLVWCIVTPTDSDAPPLDLPPIRGTSCDNNSSVVVEIEGITCPATFGRLPDALAAVWDSLRVLPLGAVQYDAFGHVLSGPGAVDRAARVIRREGGLSLSIAMNGRAHLVSVRPL
ncbi:ATP-binding protein [Kitasatospora sp. NPDC093806]|uniref:ATP-binding protein n=1 Tax=Kitasatospora sp. NPDC093806 TaxID=3155075 RepID=UPI00344AC6BE